MQTLPVKSWNTSIPSSKKYLSRMITYTLSHQLDTKKYGVVFESPLSKDDSDEPDVVVFEKSRGWASVMAIEICKSGEITDLMIVARGLMEKYSLLDFFLFDQESETWYNIKKAMNGYELSTNTLFMGVDLEKLSI